MNKTAAENYIYDLGVLVKDLAIAAKEERDANLESPDHSFYLGRLTAFHDVIALMQAQARAFQIPLSEIGVEDIDPERELV